MNKLNQNIIYSYPDVRLGIVTSAIQEEHQIRLQHNDWLLSPILDSGHEGMIWDRLFLTVSNGNIQCLIWCYDTLFKLEENELTKESATICNHASHILLNKEKGRYLRFAILNKGDQVAIFKGYECSFPYRTHLELLPQYYQSNQDLHLLFAPIEDVFLSLQAQIRSQHQMWDVRHGSEKQIQELLELLDLKEFSVFPITIIRDVLEHRHTWMKQRGTLPSLIQLATILLQRNVVVDVLPQGITITACFDHEEEAKAVTSILKQEIPCSTTLHMKWLEETTLDSAYFDLGMILDYEGQNNDFHLDTGVYLWG